MYRIEFSAKAAKSYIKLQKKLRNQVDTKLSRVAENPHEKHNNVKPLVGMNNCYRLRVGDWRVVYEVVKKQIVIYVIKIAHRKEVYKNDY